MTLEELEEIKEEFENGISYSDIAINRALSKSSMVAILNFENILLEKYKNLYEEKIGSEITKLETKYEDDINILNSNIKELESFNESKEILSLMNSQRILKDEISFLNEENINLEREISKYENSFFSFIFKFGY